MRAILFDWDGTLVDSLGAFQHANAAVMAAFGLPLDEAIYRRHYVPDWRLMYLRLGVPGDRLDEANELWHATFAQADGRGRVRRRPRGARAARREPAAASAS